MYWEAVDQRCKITLYSCGEQGETDSALLFIEITFNLRHRVMHRQQVP